MAIKIIASHLTTFGLPVERGQAGVTMVAWPGGVRAVGSGRIGEYSSLRA